MQDLETYAGTTSRCGQRIVNAMASEHADFVLFSFDVSQAFAKGMALAELSALTGLDIREVQFDIPRGDLDVLRQLDGFQSLGPARETLDMVKPI